MLDLQRVKRISRGWKATQTRKGAGAAISRLKYPKIDGGTSVCTPARTCGLRARFQSHIPFDRFGAIGRRENLGKFKNR